MSSARDDLDLIVDKFAKEIVIASGEVLNATNLTNVCGYLRRTPQVRRVDEHLQALQIIVKKDVDVFRFKKLDFNTFNQLQKSCKLLELTQEEYDLVSKVVKEITENE